jgi:hypothetical protein
MYARQQEEGTEGGSLLQLPRQQGNGDETVQAAGHGMLISKRIQDINMILLIKKHDRKFPPGMPKK